MSLANKVLMIEPNQFQYNAETAADNFFQTNDLINEEVSLKAQEEYLQLKKKLDEAGIEVSHYKIKDDLFTPDALFPNNWFSTDPSGALIIYPMKSPVRRLERRESILGELKKKYTSILDLSRNEERGLFLEGTGSLVMDHNHRIAYSSLSQRTSANLLQEWAKHTNYELVIFTSYDLKNQQVYHTNVMLSIGQDFAVICTASIQDKDERRLVQKRLEETGHRLVEISLEQMHQFCANCLELENKNRQKFLIMSTRAFTAFSDEQKKILSGYANIIHSDLQTIESTGGGSARCMLAELF